MTDADFDIPTLHGFLDATFGAGAMALERIGGGQSNPTYFLTHAGQRMVLRKKPNGETLRGAHAVDREFRILKALQGTDVPVPRPILFHEDPALLGAPFYLMERVEGRVFHECALPGLAPAEREALYLSMAETLARLHALRPDTVGLGDYGRPGNYFERQIARWSGQWQASPSGPIPALDDLIAWLTAHKPPDDGHSAIAHGDFRLGNLLIHPAQPRVVAVLDWELSTLGETPPLQRFHVAFALFRFAVIFVGIADRARAGSAASAEAASLGPLAARFARRGMDVTRGGFG